MTFINKIKQIAIGIYGLCVIAAVAVIAVIALCAIAASCLVFGPVALVAIWCVIWFIGEWIEAAPEKPDRKSVRRESRRDISRRIEANVAKMSVE